MMSWIKKCIYYKKMFIIGGFQYLHILKMKKIVQNPLRKKVFINDIIGFSRRNKYEYHKILIQDFNGYPRIKTQVIFSNGSRTKIIKERYIEIQPDQIFQYIKLLKKAAYVYCKKIE